MSSVGRHRGAHARKQPPDLAPRIVVVAFIHDIINPLAPPSRALPSLRLLLRL